MSLYLFTTEQEYGGNAKIFRSYQEALEHKNKFVQDTDGLISSCITEHNIFPTVTAIGSDNHCEEFYLIGVLDDNVIVCNSLDKLKSRPTHRVIDK